MKSRPWRRYAIAALASGLLGAGAALAQDAWVSAANVTVMDDMGAWGNPVVTLKQGDKLMVIEHEDGGWLKVQSGSNVGYVYKDALSAQRVGADSFADARDTNASASAGAASKGFTDQEYADKKGLDEKYLKAMEAATKAAINRDSLMAFQQEGNVGPKHTAQ